MLVLDHLIVGTRARLRQLHLGDEFFDDVLPRHVLTNSSQGVKKEFVNIGDRGKIQPTRNGRMAAENQPL